MTFIHDIYFVRPNDGGQPIVTVEGLNEHTTKHMRLAHEEGFNKGREQGIRDAVTYLVKNYCVIPKDDLQSTLGQYAIAPVGRTGGRYKLSEYDREEIHRIYRQGYSKRKIADMYGISEKTIRNYLKQPE